MAVYVGKKGDRLLFSYGFCVYKKHPCDGCIYYNKAKGFCHKLEQPTWWIVKKGPEKCEFYLSEEEWQKNKWENLTDKAIVNHYHKRIIVHDFSGLKHIDLERARDLGYEIEFETDPFSH